MKRFSCQSCNHLVGFEATQCGYCGITVGYLPEFVAMTALKPQADGTWFPLEQKAEGKARAFCINHVYGVCNWLTLAADSSATAGFCVACQFNRMIPNLNVPENKDRWYKLEVAKHRMFYTILRLKLPFKNRRQDPENGLAFDFLDDAADGSVAIMTGHSNGIITIATKEADDAYREKMRIEMGEYYRTLLGHFRHEIGHYYWNILVRDGGNLEACRAIFGDDRADYQAALQTYYAQSPPQNWRENFVSFYATSHPWEDFAETWAHYFHIVSTLETALAYDMTVSATVGGDALLSPHGDPYTTMPFEEIINAWVPLTYAVNNLNRSMGLPDFYPFTLTQGVVHKLHFIHDLIRNIQNKS
ncbi:hypothetical protein A4S02_08170 [Acetobacter ascendens]|uniref:Zinc-ribbon domain-containing protein n=1 Tax=Acetobacter ascendens TaxID=481146 RepID=A0A1D8QWN3_9PROT|nr:putative zinc-binding metallopeptidase [Acetobacter ascendens]AOW46755.1 hypothetical protein A4S02_08170 [Acetobacter ascendens]RCL08141.1 hypothetical protein BBA71_03685 [Acetobacter pasteurianus]GCD75666.1 hypothetical protein NBRC3299_1958 [Acetobacter pasteurianus NBRC 3299]